MQNRNEIFSQKANRSYVESTMGKEIWIQVSGHKELNGADAGFWATLVDIDNISVLFNDVGWDGQVGTQEPSFVQCGDDIVYQRVPEVFSPCENIVHFREFYGIKPDYVEITEEFRLLNNLYHDTENDVFYTITSGGACEEVAKIENKTCAYIKLKYLIKYACAKQKALVLFFDIRVEYDGSMKQNGFSEISDQQRTDDIFYEIWSYENEIGKKTCQSILMGKKIIKPRPVEECGYWPFEKKRTYRSYIIGIDEYGEARRYTSNPDELANYFGANPTAPHYLTPVFFSKEVLQKYYSHPEIYEIGDGFLDCASLWRLSIDNHHTDCVSVYLGDLGRDLPEEEQDHWLQYNIEPSIKLSDVAFKRDFLNIPAESTMSDIQFKHAYDALHKRWRQQFDWDLLLPLSEDDEYNIKLLRIPVTGSQDEFDHQVLSLVKSIIDSLNEKQIFKQLTNTENLAGGISKLERWLSERNVQDSELHIKFLRNLQELRSTGTGHRKGKGYEKIKKEFGIQDDLRASFSDILISATSFVNFMRDSAEILKKID